MKNTNLTLVNFKAKNAVFLLFMLVSASTFAQQKFSTNEFSVNGYRSPSVGLEFRHNHFSVHAGYYPSNFDAGITTDFYKVGVTGWFLPVGKKENPSSFYAGASYLRGFSHDYDGKNALGTEIGFRWMIWKGLNLRVGAIAVAAPGESLKLNPASGISYSFFFK